MKSKEVWISGEDNSKSLAVREMWGGGRVAGGGLRLGESFI